MPNSIGGVHFYGVICQVESNNCHLPFLPFSQKSETNMSSELDNWIEIAKQCKYLPENDLKKLCDIVCSILVEESNVQPVSTPVTVCGDIHGQVRGVIFVYFFVLK